MRRVTHDSDRPGGDGATGEAVVAVVAQSIEHAVDALPEGIPPTIREDAEIDSSGEEAIIEALDQPDPKAEQYERTWQDWQQILSEPMARLIADYTINDEELSYGAKKQLKYLADQLDIDDWLLLEQISSSLEDTLR